MLKIKEYDNGITQIIYVNGRRREPLVITHFDKWKQKKYPGHLCCTTVNDIILKEGGYTLNILHYRSTKAYSNKIQRFFSYVIRKINQTNSDAYEEIYHLSADFMGTDEKTYKQCEKEGLKIFQAFMRGLKEGEN